MGKTKKKVLRKSALLGIFILYVVVTLPILALFLVNPTVRNNNLNIAAHYRSKVVPIDTVFIGDSITAGGGQWSFRIHKTPLNAYNLASSGATMGQISKQADEAIAYSPEAICILGGTNDVFDKRYDIDHTIAEFDDLLTKVSKANIACIVTLVPYTRSANAANTIKTLNHRIETICNRHNAKVIDLNPTIAPENVLLRQYSTDQVHFSEAGYDVWSQKIREMIKKINSPDPR